MAVYLLPPTSSQLTRLNCVQIAYKALTPYLSFFAHLFCSVWGSTGVKAELNLFILEYLGFRHYGLLGCLGEELDVLSWHPQTFLWASTLHHKLQFKVLTRFTSKLIQIRSSLNSFLSAAFLFIIHNCSQLHFTSLDLPSSLKTQPNPKPFNPPELLTFHISKKPVHT